MPLKLDFNAACSLAANGMQPGWSIEVHLERGAGWVDLWTPDGHKHHLTSDQSVGDQFLEAVMVARTAGPKAGKK